MARTSASLQTAAQQAFGSPVDAPEAAPNEAVMVMPPTSSLGQPWGFAVGSVTHTAVVCDRSLSAESVCDSASLQRAYDAWLRHAAEPMSTFEVWRVGKSISDARRVFAIETPEGAVSDRVAFLLGGRNELSKPELLAGFEREVGSGIAETIAVATRSLRDRRGTLSLYILSDLRQLSPPDIDLEEGAIPTPRRFTEWLTLNGLAPDLSNVHVIACGAHNRTLPGSTPLVPRRFGELRDLWSAVFTAMHARTLVLCGTCDVSAFRSQREEK